MKLICNLGPFGVQVIEIKETDPLSVLINLLDLKDKNTYFNFKGRNYCVNTNQTFKEIGLISDNTPLFFMNQAIAG